MKTIINNQDGESKTGDFGARHYDELSGRFLSVDPLWASFPDQTPYQYGYNNPVMFKDPSGLASENEMGGNNVQTISGIDQFVSTFEEIFSGILSIFGSGGGGDGGFHSREARAARIRAHDEIRARGEHKQEKAANGRTMISGDAEEVSGGGAGGGGNTTVTPDGALLPRSAQGTFTPTYNPSGNERTRSDGSKYFGKPHEAFAYMISVQQGGKEAFGVIFEKGVLVLPTHNNEIDVSTPERSGYSITDGILNDPLNEFDKKYITTIHTHPNIGTPSYIRNGDLYYVKKNDPNNWWFVIGVGSNTISAFINGDNVNDGNGVIGLVSRDHNLSVSDLITSKGSQRLMLIYHKYLPNYK